MTTTAQEVKRVPTSEELLHPGEFILVSKREPMRRFESVPIEPPAKFFAWLKWKFGPKFTTKETIIPAWPNVDTIVINCPICNGSLGTTEHHKIASIDPLTIEMPLTCPYCRTFTFKVVEGKIMLA
jgi:hypothetical protein